MPHLIGYGNGLSLGSFHRIVSFGSARRAQNVARLKLYKSKLIVFPRRPTSQRAKKGDSSKADQKNAAEPTSAKFVLPVVQPVPRAKARAVSNDEKKAEVAKALRKARMDAKLWGRREKRAKDKRDGKSKKKAKDEEGTS
jgi:large subunit ribosomal protein L13e